MTVSLWVHNRRDSIVFVCCQIFTKYCNIPYVPDGCRTRPNYATYVSIGETFTHLTSPSHAFTNICQSVNGPITSTSNCFNIQIHLSSSCTHVNSYYTVLEPSSVRSACDRWCFNMILQMHFYFRLHIINILGDNSARYNWNASKLSFNISWQVTKHTSVMH